jgi:hypothetical protein
MSCRQFFEGSCDPPRGKCDWPGGGWNSTAFAPRPSVGMVELAEKMTSGHSGRCFCVAHGFHVPTHSRSQKITPGKTTGRLDRHRTDDYRHSHGQEQKVGTGIACRRRAHPFHGCLRTSIAATTIAGAADALAHSRSASPASGRALCAGASAGRWAVSARLFGKLLRWCILQAAVG